SENEGKFDRQMTEQNTFRLSQKNKCTMENKDTNYNRFFKLSIAWIVTFCVFGFPITLAQDATQQYSDSLLNSARNARITELKMEGLLGVSLMGKSPTDYQKGLYQLYSANTLMDYDEGQAK